MNVFLSGRMKEWVERQTQSGRDDKASEDGRDLINPDRDRVDKVAALQELVDEARASGESDKTLTEVRAAARAWAKQDRA